MRYPRCQIRWGLKEVKGNYHRCEIRKELKHFPIDHSGGLMLEMLSMHTFKHMRSEKPMENTAQYSFVPSLQASEINSNPLDSLKSTCHFVSP
ncbi:hypothetical protein CK203_040248 [Vitis vinifera]|uniref:Uncharacterized protein n=1 Tax=Vitis vinifera TaxID=29760 RepID=A0A438HXB5_VITVI|nr:hypothetical protein CK203_040248 [Vitis vinifera]